MTEKDYCLIAYIALLLLGRFIAQNQRRAEKPSGQVRKIMQDPTAIIMAVVAVISFAAPLIEFTMREDFAIHWPSIITGINVIVLGWSISTFANRTIAENWSPSIDKTEDQELITKGIYGIIRHPLYLSGLLILIGTNVYFQNMWSWLVVLLAFAVTLYRMPIEDKQLETRFGEAFAAYKQTTKAILPYLW
jgi:protein-S-isoprenylcysteine O-methyltransferase Ste14